MSRTRDLILGPLLLVGGLAFLLLYFFYIRGESTPNPHRPPGGNTYLVPVGAAALALTAAVAGILQTIRGLRGRSR